MLNHFNGISWHIFKYDEQDLAAFKVTRTDCSSKSLSCENRSSPLNQSFSAFLTSRVPIVRIDIPSLYDFSSLMWLLDILELGKYAKYVFVIKVPMMFLTFTFLGLEITVLKWGFLVYPQEAAILDFQRHLPLSFWILQMLLSKAAYFPFKVHIFSVLALPGNRTHDLVWLALCPTVWVNSKFFSCSGLLNIVLKPSLRLRLVESHCFKPMCFSNGFSSRSNGVSFWVSLFACKKEQKSVQKTWTSTKSHTHFLWWYIPCAFCIQM